MSRVRASQINDLQLKYTSFVTPNVTSDSKIDISGPGLLSFFGQMSTGVLGGGPDSTSAFLQAINSDPYIGIVPGDSFNIKIPDFLGGNPVQITFVSGDFITLNGLLSTTAARVSARVNATMTAAGISSGTLCAGYIDGILQFRSVNASGYTTGPSSSITLTGVTSGILQSIGFGPGNIHSVNGINGPKRGVATKTVDLMGSYVPLKTLSKEELSTRNTANVHVGGRNVTAETPGGQLVLGRISETPTGVRLRFLSQGQLRPVSKTSFSDFTSLSVGETFTITVSDIDTLLSTNVNVTILAPIATAQQVVDLINVSWQTATSINSAGARQAILTGNIPEPFNLRSNSILNISLNGSTTVVADISGSKTASDVISIIQN